MKQTTIYKFLLRLLAFVVVTVSMPVLLNGTFVDCAAAAITPMFPGLALMNTLMVAGAIAVAIFLVDTIALTIHRIRRKKILK